MSKDNNHLKTGVSYFGVRNPKRALEDIKDMKNHHCSFVVHTFSENDLYYYRDTLAEITALTKKEGLETYLDPWGVGSIFGGEAFSQFANLNLETRQVQSDGNSPPASCPNHPMLKEYLKSWIDAAAECEPDYIFWDEPHFYMDKFEKEKRPTRWSCLCPICRELYRERFGEDMPESKSDQVEKFQADCIFELLKELCDYAKDKGLKNAVCMLPKSHDHSSELWEKVISLPSVDIFGTDPYWWADEDVIQLVGDISATVLEMAEKYNKEAQVWIKGFMVPAGDEQKVIQAIQTAYNAGIRNIAVWSYAATGFMTSHKCGKSELLWDLIGQVFGILKSGPQISESFPPPLY